MCFTLIPHMAHTSSGHPKLFLLSLKTNFGCPEDGVFWVDEWMNGWMNVIIDSLIIYIQFMKFTPFTLASVWKPAAPKNNRNTFMKLTSQVFFVFYILKFKHLMDLKLIIFETKKTHCFQFRITDGSTTLLEFT